MNSFEDGALTGAVVTDQYIQVTLEIHAKGLSDALESRDDDVVDVETVPSAAHIHLPNLQKSLEKRPRKHELPRRFAVKRP